MKPFPFEIHYSLMDRFIHTFNSKANPQITDWILRGSNSKLWEKRAEWFDYKRKRFEWGINCVDEGELQKEVTEAIYLVFAILGNESEEEEYKGISKIFNDIVRLAVLDKKQDITTYSKYTACIRSADVALQYLLYSLGFVEDKEYAHKMTDKDGKIGGTQLRVSIQLRGENLWTDQSGNLSNITFGNVCFFFKNRIEKLETIGSNDRYKPYWQTRNVANAIYRLKDARNEESHRAFYTDPEKYWNRLVYMLFDYITITFYLLRYLKEQVKQLQINSGDKLYEKEDVTAVVDALLIADKLIKESKEIHVRFQYKKARSRQEKLLISEWDAKQTVNDIRNPKEETDNDNIICYYDKILIRTASYGLQSYEVKNGKDIAIGKRLELNASLLFNGAVVQLTMPTKTVPYPNIDDIIARSTGLIEDSEYRDMIEKVLVSNIPNEEFRSKLRVLLLLDEGDKESIIKNFMDEKKSVNPSTVSDEFKSFIEKKSDESLERLKDLFDDLGKTLQTNQEDLKDYISDAVGKIDLRSILDSNSEIKKEISDLRDWIDKWCEKQEKLSKKNAQSAQEMQASLKKAIEDSSVNTVSQLKDIFQSQTNQWKKKTNKKLNLIIGLSAFSVIILLPIIIIFLCYFFDGKDFTYYWFNKFPSEWMAQQAISQGNVTIVCRYANELEKKGDITGATEWWAKNLKLMESLLHSSEDKAVKEYALENLLYQYLGGKGCNIDYKKALEYGKQLRESYNLMLNSDDPEKSGVRLQGESSAGLKAYLYALNGNYREALLNANKTSRKSFRILQDALSALEFKAKISDATDFEWLDMWIKNIDDALSESSGSFMPLEGLIMKGKIFESEGQLYEAYENYHQAGLENYTKGYVEEYRLISKNCPIFNIKSQYEFDQLMEYPSIATWHLNEGLKLGHYKSFFVGGDRNELDSSNVGIGEVNSEIAAAFTEVKYLFDSEKPYITIESVDEAFTRAKLINDSIIEATGYVHMDFDSKFILSKLQASVGKRYLDKIAKSAKDSVQNNIPVLPSMYREYSSKDSTYISDLAKYFTISNIIYDKFAPSDLKSFVVQQLLRQASKRISESAYADDLFVLEYGKLLSSQKKDETRRKGIHMINQTYMRSSDEGIKWECSKVLMRDQLREPLLYNELIQTIVNYVADAKGLKNCDLKKIEDIDTKQRVILRIAKELDVKSDYDLLGILWSYVSILELSKDKVNEDKESFYYELSKIGNPAFGEFMESYRQWYALKNGHQDYLRRMIEKDPQHDSFDDLLEKYYDKMEGSTSKNDFIVLTPFVP